MLKSHLNVCNHPSSCGVLMDYVPEFYFLLDNFENAGFAVGLDILEEDVILADPSDLPCFTGFPQICSLLIYL
jgi:hypothetical protein